jgi:RNA polymerase sigma factor (TIGR02999 family)
MPPAPDSTTATVTRLLAGMREGDRGAFDSLVPLIYAELHELARRQRRAWHGNHTIDTTALVHEAYLKLVGREQAAGNRSHFFAVAARAMRHILCNYARERRRQKRGGGAPLLSLDELQHPPGTIVFDEGDAEQLSALEDALVRLEHIDPRQARVVECRFFGGLTIEDTAEALGVSPATVKRSWAMARAWLYRELAQHAPDGITEHDTEPA